MLRTLFTALMITITLAAPALAATPAPLVVHEWGTFTSLQDEDGQTLGGLNVDDEPLPNFVHDVSRKNLIGQGDRGPATYANKGMPGIGAHPQVTMRLETPVIYFYPPADWARQPVDVEVEFHGGWLTQFYPDAAATTPGLDIEQRRFGPLTQTTVGKLAWTGIEIGGDGQPPTTDSAVWLAPRAVRAATVSRGGGKEHEKYLFYRGVGNLESPVRAPRVGQFLQVEDRGRAASGGVWLVEVADDQRLAFRRVELRNDGTAAQRVRGSSPGEFTGSDFSARRHLELRDEMRAAMTAEGLFPDEADAMLNTWEASYFKSPGQRLFFLTTQAWTDRVLPLQISVPTKVVRVMMGRIELVTPAQREQAKKLAAALSPKEGIEAYHKLGRFRNAILLNEQSRTPTEPLDSFIKAQNLQAYRVP